MAENVGRETQGFLAKSRTRPSAKANPQGTLAPRSLGTGQARKPTRREFLATTAGLALAWDPALRLVARVCGPAGNLARGLTEARAAQGAVAPSDDNARTTRAAEVLAPSVFLEISPDGIRVICHRSEMGQGTRTAMAMLVAEELEVGLERIRIVQADGDDRYGNQNTDGSRSVRTNWRALREVGATARAMLISAAARRWKSDRAALTTDNGRVVNRGTGASLSYEELAALAAKEPVPTPPPLKKETRLLGRPARNADIDALLAGEAQFGIDTRIEGMLTASLERSPRPDGKLESLDASEALKIPGVVRVFRLDRHGSGFPIVGNDALTNVSVAVVATNTWAALEGRRKLKIQWANQEGEGTPELESRLAKAIEAPGKGFREAGDFGKAKAEATRTLRAVYRTSMLCHQTMEPPACVARVGRGECEIWAPTQDPQRARSEAAKLLGLQEKRVRVHVTFLGGGFGRKSQPDFVLETVAVANELKGKPVKLVWTREDEIRHGFYHAPSAQVLEAALDTRGNLAGWRHLSAFPTILKLFTRLDLEPGGFELGMGASNFPYAVPHLSIEGRSVPCDARIAWYRSVCNLFHSFAVNGFLDEVAEATGKDPVQLRLELLKPHGVPEWDKGSEHPLHTGRLARVIERVAAEAGVGPTLRPGPGQGTGGAPRPGGAASVGDPLPPGTGVGLACHFSFFSYVAVAIRARVDRGADGARIRVERADVAIDCGATVNPDTVRAQMEGSVIFGLSAALHGRITMEKGRVSQSNFHDAPLLRMGEAPEIRVHLVESTEPPTGVGEPGVPPVAPALAAALYRATGRRFRELPIRL